MGQMSTVRQALADTLNNAPSLSNPGATPSVIAYTLIPDSVNVPCVIVEPGSTPIDYQTAMRSSNADWTMDLLILASRSNETAGQEIIDELASPDGTRSIPAILQADPTLGGQVSYAVPVQMRDYGRFPVGGVEYLGCRIEVEVNL